LCGAIVDFVFGLVEVVGLMVDWNFEYLEAMYFEECRDEVVKVFV